MALSVSELLSRLPRPRSLTGCDAFQQDEWETWNGNGSVSGNESETLNDLGCAILNDCGTDFRIVNDFQRNANQTLNGNVTLTCCPI